ncbi:bridge-like lipid transfer protein family member 3A isoform X3 [Condylostylus longicornis]|uniref:bridge-like lipid transfer protein family member 3A isoform X3 n=1 Tax=Condylostylus longicornis TaxID=2530218 RepID=UPI00244E414B|nr:bridge-like lipid transfer protein family member 3A isoform X3 [Condylostylus longicornis]
MVSIIKNQLLKHLSRYTKNLSPDKINLSTFRGEGDLSNLELDEVVLTDLLELPSWLRLTSAWCNHVSFRISWTKLKSVPITLVLDEVKIAIETCELGTRSNSNATTPTASGGMQALQTPQGKYSFIHKVIDGITIIINTVNVKFASPAFTSSIEVARIRVESKTPKWSTADLRLTRLKDVQKGIVLIFKELSWQTVRIEASSTQDTGLTPLRLLTNNATCRITIRKRLSDCSILASCLLLILEDLLWVLTDSQLKAALHFVDSLSGLIKSTTQTTQKTKAQKKLENLPEYQAQIAQSQQGPAVDLSHQSQTQKIFNMFDIRETSYHFFSKHIDLHLCDDEGDGRSMYPDLKEGGALLISIKDFQTDYYPYHLAKADRSRWHKYKEASIPPALWLEQSLNVFRESVLNLCQPNRPLNHAPLERSVPVTPTSIISHNVHPFGTDNNICTPNISSVPQSGQSTPKTLRGRTGSTASGAQNDSTNRTVSNNLAKLMSACVILRIGDFVLYRVTTSGKKQMQKEFVAAQQKRKPKSGDKDRYSFPPEMSLVHAEFTYFYYPGDFIFPLPPSKMFCYINPIQVHFDLSSVLWLNSFALNLHESLLKASVGMSNTSTGDSIAKSANEPDLMYMDIKLEAIMPRIVIESAIDAPTQRDRPKIMQIQVSRFVLTNIRETGSSRADLAQALDSLQEGSLVFGSGFPSANGDLCIVTDRILSHVAATDVPNSKFAQQEHCNEQHSGTETNIGDLLSCLSRYVVWSEPRDVWCIKFDPVWIDFLGAKSLGSHKAIPFVDAVPITLWVHGSSNSQDIENIKRTVSDYHIPLRRGSAQSVINTQLDYENSNVLILPESQTQSKNMTHPQKFSQFDSKIQESYASYSNNKIPECADMHAIAHVSNLVSIQIDHYQLLFLMRLAEEMTELTTFLTIDAERILKKQNIKKSIIFGCVVPQVEITMVMPSPTPGKESSGGDAESVLPDSASLVTNTTWQQSFDNVKSTNPFGSVDTPSPVTNDPPFDSNGTHIPNPNPRGHNVQIQNATAITSSTISQSSRHDTGIFSQSIQSPVTASFTKGSNSNSSVVATNKKGSITESTIRREIEKKVKRGFSNFMTSIDSAIKSGSSVISDDISDTFSIYSDVSSDSENFAIVMGDDKTTDCIDVMFRLNPFTNDSNVRASPVEIASEVYEESNYKTNMSSPSEPSEGSCWRRRDLVSMATFRLTTVELIRQNEGYKSSFKLQVSAISCDECGAIPWDELQTVHQSTKTKFGARCRAWNLAPYNPEAPPVIQLRMEEVLEPPENITEIKDKKVIQRWFTSHADIKVKDLTMDLSMSTVTGLGDLVEDEVITPPLTLNINLENVRLNLIEDRPPVNITSPGPVPINLAISKLFITRDSSGLLRIEPNVVNNIGADQSSTNRGKDLELLSMQLVMRQLKLDNEMLRKELILTREHSESVRQKSRQDTEILNNDLKAAKDDIAKLTDEKIALMNTIKSLQNRLSAYQGNAKKPEVTSR